MMQYLSNLLCKYLIIVINSLFLLSLSLNGLFQSFFGQAVSYHYTVLKIWEIQNPVSGLSRNISLPRRKTSERGSAF